jgi:hypothetical protein
MRNEKDFLAERARIERIVVELTPHRRVEFDPEEPDRIKFTIIDQNTNTVLATSGPRSVRQWTGKPDEWVRQFICHPGGGDKTNVAIQGSL